jgi:Kef-type K+ transport system membrane component KefB
MQKHHTGAFARQPLKRWFWAGAIATLLFELFGAASIYFTLTVDPATLPLDQKVMVEALPGWMKIASVVAVTSGVIGAILLLLRRKAAEPVLLLSLAAVVVQDSAYVLHRPLFESISSDQLLVPVIVLVLCWTIYWFARHSRQRGWLV